MASASRSFPLSLNTSKSVDVPSVPSVGGRVVRLSSACSMPLTASKSMMDQMCIRWVSASCTLSLLM